MICKTCNQSGVYNEANNQGFYYCRACKIEIELEVATAEKELTDAEVYEYFDTSYKQTYADDNDDQLDLFYDLDVDNGDTA